MLLNLSSLEKKAISKVLLDIVNADGKISGGEVLYFQQLQKALGISDEELQEAKFMSVIGCLAILKGLLLHEKEALAIMMLEMIRADGKVDDEELKVFAVVCAAADIPLPNIS